MVYAQDILSKLITCPTFFLLDEVLHVGRGALPARSGIVLLTMPSPCYHLLPILYMWCINRRVQMLDNIYMYI